MRFEIEEQKKLTVLRVVGIGGAGGNAVNRMVEAGDAGFKGVDFIAINTDLQVLRESRAYEKIQIGEDLTRGLGSGGDRRVGRDAAEESIDIIRSCVDGADMVFLTAGMGGGTGTGAAPVIAQAAKEQGILTVAIVTKPFHFEARRRMSIAEKGIEELAAHVDSLITIPNAKLADVLGGETLLLNAFKAANDVLQGAVQGIAELITRPGLINVDFADVRTVMSEMGMAMMGSGHSSGDDRAIMAAQAAIGSPLLEDINLSGACGILVNITAGTNLTMKEFEEVGSTVSDLASEDATVVMGTVIDPDMGDDLRVTVVATGLGEPRRSETFREKPMRLVANGHNDQAEVAQPEEAIFEEVMKDREERFAKVENEDLFGRQKDIDYLDIPSFLRTQAD